MKKTYSAPALEIKVFDTEDVLEASGNVIVTPPQNGGEVEVGDKIDIF